MSKSKNSQDSKTMGIKELALAKSRSENLQLEKLVSNLESDLGYGKDRILNRLHELKEEDRIALVERVPYSTLWSFVFSPYSLWFWGVVLSVFLSLVLILVTSGPLIYLRYVFGGLVVLFLPGYSLIQLLYAKRKELDDLTRFALSLGLSLAIVPLAGLALNYTPWGIRLVPIAVTLAGLCIVLSFFAVRRKHAYYKLERDVLPGES